MVRIVEMPAVARDMFAGLEFSGFDDPAFVAPAPAARRRVAIVSTAGVSRRGERPFSWLARDYRGFGRHERDLVMSHVAVDFDRTAWQQDLNAIIPLDRLEEMARAGEIGSVADVHYSFMGASDPATMQESAHEVAGLLKDDNVDTVLLVPI